MMVSGHVNFNFPVKEVHQNCAQSFLTDLILPKLVLGEARCGSLATARGEIESIS